MGFDSKLGIVAGRGQFPALLMAACRSQGRPFHVLALKGHAEPDVIGDGPADWVTLGQAGRGFELLRQQGVGEVVFIGGVTRPSLRDLTPDWQTTKFLTKIGIKALGDDGLLRAIADLCESEGFTVVGIDSVLEECLSTVGLYGTIEPDAQAMVDADRGWTVAKALGALDVGQAAVVQQGLVLGVEGIEGTDALIDRCGALARPGPGGVLVKVKKPQQDRRLDLPTIGVETIRRLAAAGLRGLVIEAGGTLVLDRAALTAEADRLGVFVLGRAEDVPC